LFRVAVAPDATGAGPVPIVPDPRRRIPGRGAWLHPDQRCVELAERRRAFTRALRVPGPVDPAAVCEYVAHAGLGTTATGGTPQEMSS
jgi:Predicted nucleic-acid-binding protein implicated in transcription termination